MQPMREMDTEAIRSRGRKDRCQLEDVDDGGKDEVMGDMGIREIEREREGKVSE